MKQRRNHALFIVAGLVLVAAGLLLVARRSGPADSEGQAADSMAGPLPGPIPPVGPAPQVAPGPRAAREPGQTGPRLHVSARAEDLTAEERAEFEKKFATKLKPAIERWCKVYAGHTPFRPEDITADKLRQIIFPGSPAQGYGFVVNGTTVCVEDNRGNVYLQYIMAPAARQLDQLPKAPAPPMEPTMTRPEIMRLLKADSGKDFRPNEVAITPTSWSGAMNGGVYVDVGQSVYSNAGGVPEYSMVFGPDGNLACYLRGKAPKGAGGRQR